MIKLGFATFRRESYKFYKIGKIKKKRISERRVSRETRTKLDPSNKGLDNISITGP